MIKLQEPLIEPSFYVGSIPVLGHAILAPMDGYSDLPFRVLARELGSAMSYTEFINARDVIYGKRPGYEKRLAYLEEERPVVFQVYDDDPNRILKAALKLEEKRPDIIDVNMGCPAKKVVGGQVCVGIWVGGIITQLFVFDDQSDYIHPEAIHPTI